MKANRIGAHNDDNGLLVYCTHALWRDLLGYWALC